MLNRSRHASKRISDAFMRNPAGLYISWEFIFRSYPKQILSTSQQVQSYIDTGMTVDSVAEAEVAMLEIDYYPYISVSFSLARQSVIFC